MCIGFYVVATSGRLARFNISEPPGGDRIFYGIPTTLVGAFLASGFLTWALHGAPPELLRFFPALLLVSGVAMVSNVRLPKLKGRSNKWVHWFQIANIAVVYVATPFKVLPEYLFVLSILYMAVGIAWAARHPVEELLAEAA
jgi:CDP-diacylglycerol---serine O-phosphatidyltransferase